MLMQPALRRPPCYIQIHFPANRVYSLSCKRTKNRIFRTELKRAVFFKRPFLGENKRCGYGDSQTPVYVPSEDFQRNSAVPFHGQSNVPT